MIKLSLAFFWCLVAWGTVSAATTLNVRDFGALGNGVADDYAAIGRAVAALKTRSDAELFFPTGYYLINTSGAAVIDLSGAKRAGIRFAADAVLLMNNSDTHAIAVEGTGSVLNFDNVNIEWKNKPERRGSAAAFYFDTTTPGDFGDFLLTNCRISNAPGCGVSARRVKNIRLRNLAISYPGGEGVRLSRCQEFQLQGVRVQYSAAAAIALLPDPADTAEPWSNRDGVLRQIEANGGGSPGIHLVGVAQIQVETANLQEKSVGILLESGALAPYGVVPPPVKVELHDVEATACGNGIELICHSPELPAARNFDLAADNLRLNGNRNDNLAISGVDGGRFLKLRVNTGRIRLRDFSGLALTDLRMRNGYLALADGNAKAGTPVLKNIGINQGYFRAERLDGVTVENLSIVDAPETAFELIDCRAVVFRQLQISRPNRKSLEDIRALKITGGDELTLEELQMELDSRVVMPFDLAGGKIRLRGKLKVPAEYYQIDQLLRLPSAFESGHPVLDMEITVALGPREFVLLGEGASGGE